VSTWAELQAAGYRRVLGMQIEGIAVDLIEVPLLTTADELAAASTGRTEAVPAMRVSEQENVLLELGRWSGVASGRALEVQLDRAVLGEYSDTVDLFRQPTLRAVLSVTVSNPAATTFNVVSTTGWSNAGHFYAGREYCTYTSTTATSFTGVTRAVAGYAHYHESETVSAYATLTNTPVYWRGRLVVIFEHLVGPDGRFAGSAVNTVGTFCRELWKGFIDAQPMPYTQLMSLRMLPIERLLTQKLNAARTGQVITAAPLSVAGSGSALNGLVVDSYYMTAADKVYVSNQHSAAENGQFPRFQVAGMQSLQRWAVSICQDVDTYLSSFVTYFPEVLFDNETHAPYAVRFIFRAQSGGSREFVSAAPLAWFIGNVQEAEIRDPTDTRVANSFTMELAPNQAPVSWMLVAIDADATGEPRSWPTSGYILLEGEGEDAVEVARYDTIDTSIDPAGLHVAIRVIERQLMGTQRLNPWREETRITVLAGASGTISDVLRTIATSSGTGARGAFDTLGFGFGWGVPDSWLDTDKYPLNTLPCDAATDEDSSLEDLVGGWLVLLGRCLVQRRQDDGIIRIEAVPTTIDASSYVTTLTSADILLGAAQVETLYDTPNMVRIEDSHRAKRRVGQLMDVPRQQAEGAREIALVAPSITPADVVVYGTRILRLSDGQMVLTLHVAPTVTLQVGDACRLDIDHPLAWDWESGTSSGTIVARVVGAEDPLDAGPRKLTFLCPGQAQAGKVLCPAAKATARPASDEMTVDNVTGFEAGQFVIVYRRGNDTTKNVRREIKSITGLVVEFTATVDLTDYPADGDTWMTYDEIGTATADQQEHLYIVAGDEFI
jgi:hypothetical protein